MRRGQTTRRECLGTAALNQRFETGTYGDRIWDRVISSSPFWAAPTAAAPARRSRPCRPDMRPPPQCSAATAAALEANSNFDFPTLLARCRAGSADVGRRAAPTSRSGQRAPRLNQEPRSGAEEVSERMKKRRSQDPELPREARRQDARTATSVTRRPPRSSSAKAWASHPRSRAHVRRHGADDP